jgi:hypothetical protein
MRFLITLQDYNKRKPFANDFYVGMKAIKSSFGWGRHRRRLLLRQGLCISFRRNLCHLYCGILFLVCPARRSGKLFDKILRTLQSRPYALL